MAECYLQVMSDTIIANITVFQIPYDEPENP